jgi:Thrombospondin type 3 repeat
VAPELALQAELFGELIPSGLHDAPTGDAAMGPAHTLDAIEALVGAHYQVERRFNVGVALGRGLTSAPGTAAVRGTIAVTFTPTAKRGITGRSRTMVDTDGDGIPDDVDKCPTEPEDKDGFQDEDGCPDPDNDGDGIPDTVDKCPNLAEDKDGFEDADGCPDVDNDHDGILDRFDKCPNEPETINGFQDEDGCPDAGPGLVTIVKDRVTLGESIALTPGGKISPTSFNLLGQLGATLRAHTELIKIRLKGKHAQLVIDWLVQYGIATMRLEAQPGDDLEITIVDRY